MPCAKQFEKPESIPETAAAPRTSIWESTEHAIFVFKLALFSIFIQLSDSV